MARKPVQAGRGCGGIGSNPELALAGFIASNGAEEIDLAKGRPVLIRKIELKINGYYGQYDKDPDA